MHFTANALRPLFLISRVLSPDKRIASTNCTYGPGQSVTFRPWRCTMFLISMFKPHFGGNFQCTTT